jgi:hypothetical protein
MSKPGAGRMVSASRPTTNGRSDCLKWLANSREEGSVSCWFTAQLQLELENGETKTISMATDSCATWMSEGVAYGFGEVTEDGINGNEEFYSLFAPTVIHEKSKEGMDVLVDYLLYLN